MNQDNSDNPFQSPIVPENDTRRGFPAGVFCGIAVALIAFCGALLWVWPGLGILASLLVVPGLLRGFIQIYRRVGGTEGGMGTLPQILFSILLMIPVLLATVISFGVTCFAAVMVVSGLDSLFRVRPPFGMIIVVGAVPLLVATLTFALMFWMLLFNRKKRPGQPDEASESEEIP